MKRLLYIIIGIAVSLTTKAVGLGEVKYLPQDSVTICQLLTEVQRQASTACLPLFFAQKFIGRPYVASTLEGDKRERLVVNTRQLDCTTLVETVTALTLCAQRKQYTWFAYKHILTDLRYRGGVVNGYPSRLHYFTEWITDNTRAGVVTEIQSPNPPFSAVQTVKVDYMSTHPKSYQALREHPEFTSEIAKMEREVTGGKYRYIPKQAVGNHALLRKVICDGDIIAITCNKAGLDIAHLGFAVWRKDGLHLLNASQLHKKVVTEPMTLYQYLQKHPSHTGIRIIRINK
ncbi:MAG: DUF1460 domain-containing protein [Prevotella sp.]|nr:DUF1460 domain-containing protein [Prevotella sp.]